MIRDLSILATALLVCLASIVGVGESARVAVEAESSARDDGKDVDPDQPPDEPVPEASSAVEPGASETRSRSDLGLSLPRLSARRVDKRFLAAAPTVNRPSRVETVVRLERCTVLAAFVVAPPVKPHAPPSTPIAS